MTSQMNDECMELWPPKGNYRGFFKESNTVSMVSSYQMMTNYGFLLRFL